MHCGEGYSLGSSWPHIPYGDYTCPARKINAASQSDIIPKKDNAININCLVIDTQAKKFLLGKQKQRNGDGFYALPGGHLQVGDSWIECADRELKEETGLENVHNWELTYITNDVVKGEGNHSLTLFMRGEIEGDTKTKLSNSNRWDVGSGSPLILNGMQNNLKSFHYKCCMRLIKHSNGTPLLQQVIPI